MFEKTHDNIHRGLVTMHNYFELSKVNPHFTRMAYGPAKVMQEVVRTCLVGNTRNVVSTKYLQNKS